MKMKNITDFVFRRQIGSKDVQSYHKSVESLLEFKATTPHANEPCELSGHCRATFLMDFSPDGSRMASSHGDHTVRITDLSTRKCTHILRGHPRTPWCLAFHQSSNDILASGCLGGEVRIWDLHGRGSEVWTAPHGSVIATLAFHPTDHVLVFATADEIYFWDWSKSRPFACCKTARNFERVRWLRFDPLGHYLYTGIANATTIQPRIHIGNRATSGINRSSSSQTDRQTDRRLRTDFRNRRRHLQERYQEVLRQYHSYERTQPELNISLDLPAPSTIPLDEELAPYVSLVTPQSPVHEDNLRSARQYAAEISEAVRGALEIPFTRVSLRHYQERPRRQQEFLGASSQSAFYTPAPASSTSSSSMSSSSSSFSGSAPAASASSTSISDNDFSVGAVESLTLNDDTGYSRPSRSSESFQNGTPTPSTSGSVTTEAASIRNHSDVRFTGLDDIYRPVPSEFFRPSRLLSWQPSQYIRRDFLYKSSAAGTSDQNDSESSPLPSVRSSSSSTSTSNPAASASTSSMPCTDHKKLSSTSLFQRRNYYSFLNQEFNLGNTSKSSKTTSKSSSSSTSNGNNNTKNTMTAKQSRNTLFKLLHSNLPSSTSTNGSLESSVPDSSENLLLGYSSNSMNDSKPSTSDSTNFSTEHCGSDPADNKSIDSSQKSTNFMQCKRPSSPRLNLSVSSACTKCNSSPASQNLVNGSYEKRDTVSAFSDSFAKTCCCTPGSMTSLKTTAHSVNKYQSPCSRLSKASTSNRPSSQNTLSPTLAGGLSLFSENKSEESLNRLKPVAETSLSSSEQNLNSLVSDRNQLVKNRHSEKTEDNSMFIPATDQKVQNVCDHSEVNQSSSNQPKERNSAAIRHLVAQNSRLATLASMPLFPSCMRNLGNRPKRPHPSDSSDENQQSKFPRIDNNNQSSGRHALFMPRILPFRSFLRYESSLSNQASDESGASSSTTPRPSVEDPPLALGAELLSRSPMNNPSTLTTAVSGSSTSTDIESESNEVSASQSASSPSSTAGSMNGPARTSSVSPFRSISMNNGLPRNLSDRLDACKMNLQILETLNSTYRENPSSSAASSSSSSSIPASFTPNTESCISPPPPLPDSASAAGCSDPSQRSTLLHNVFSSYPSTSSSLPSLSSSSSSSIETNSYLIGISSSGTSSQYNGTVANNLPSTSRAASGASCSRESTSASSANSNTIKPYQRQAGSLKSAFHSICRALSMSSTSPTSTENTYTSLQTPTTTMTSSTSEELLSTAKPTCKVTSSCNKRTCNSDLGVTAFSSSKQKAEMTNSAETSSKWNNDRTAEATSSEDVNTENNTCWQQMSRLMPVNAEAAASSSADSNQPVSSSNSSVDSALLLPPPAPPPLTPLPLPLTPLPPPPPYTASLSSFSSFPLSNKPMKTTATHAKEPIFCPTSRNSSQMNTAGLTSPALLSLASASVSTASSSSTGTSCNTKSSQNKMEIDVSSRDSLTSDQSISKSPHTTAGSYFNLNSLTDKVCPIESSACVTSSSSAHCPYVLTSQSRCGDGGQPENCSDLETSCLSLSGDHTPHTSSVSNQPNQLRTQVRRPPSKTTQVKLLKSVPSTSAASAQDCKSGTSFLTKDKLESDKSSSLSSDGISETGASPQITHSMTQSNQSTVHQLSPSGSMSAGQSAHNSDYGTSSTYQSDSSVNLLNWDELDSSSADSTNSHPSSSMRPPSRTYDIPVFEPSSMVSNRTSIRSMSDFSGFPRTCRPQNHIAREFESSSFTIPNINDNPGAATNEAFDTLCAVASATCDITEVTARLHQELDDLDRRMASLQQRCAARLARVHVPSREVVGLERWSANHNVDEFVCSVRNTLDGIAQLRRHERLVQQTAAASLYPDDINSRLDHGRSNERLDESARLSNEAREEISRSLRREISKQTKLLRLQERILQRLRQRQIHQHYVNTTSSSEDALPRPSDTLQAAINRAIAGAFLGRGEIAVATNIINLTHRIQRWDFRKLELPDLTNISDNVIVSHCKLHNDASCDISQDGCLLATFVPTHRGFPDDTVLAIYSLQEDTLGQCLYTKGFGPNAISVSISPKNHYVLVGLAAKRISWVFTTNQMVAQVYELSQEFAGEQSMKHVNDITHYVDADMRTHVSVNSAKWLPQVGGGLVYGTNRGNLHLCWPGFKPQKKENATERDEEWNTLNQAQSLRRNLYRVQHIRRNLINMPSVPQRLLHTTSTATQTSHRQVQRSAGTQTDGSEEEEGNWDSD